MLKKCQLLGHVWLFLTPWTVSHQTPLSMEFSRQDYLSGLPFPSPGDLPHAGIEPRSPALQVDSLPSEPPGESWPQIRKYVTIHTQWDFPGSPVVNAPCVYSSGLCRIPSLVEELRSHMPCGTVKKLQILSLLSSWGKITPYSLGIWESVCWELQAQLL